MGPLLKTSSTSVPANEVGQPASGKPELVSTGYVAISGPKHYSVTCHLILKGKGKNISYLRLMAKGRAQTQYAMGKKRGWLPTLVRRTWLQNFQVQLAPPLQN